MLISVIRTVILYVFIIAALRLMGKRQIGEMQPSELVVTMVISDIASLPMQNTSQPLLSGVVPVLILVALEIALSVIMMKSRFFRRIICGSPVVLIDDGKLLQNQMRRLRLTTGELCAQLRSQNIFSLDDVQYCIAETNGTMSVLEKPQKRTPNADEMGIKAAQTKPDSIVVSDGKIIERGLSLCGRKRSDIFKILKTNKTPLDRVFIMTLNSDGKYKVIEKEQG